MEVDMFMKPLNSLGALFVLALLVWKSPAIVDKINSSIQTIITHVQDIQIKTLVHTENQISRLVTSVESRFASMEKLISENTKATTDLIQKLEDSR